MTKKKIEEQMQILTKKIKIIKKKLKSRKASFHNYKHDNKAKHLQLHPVQWEKYHLCLADTTILACMSQPSQLPETWDSFKTERLQEAAQLNSPQGSDTFSHSKRLALVSW